MDRAILRELQDRRPARRTSDLAQRVHLSPSACLRRVKALEDARRHRPATSRCSTRKAVRRARHQLHDHQPRKHAAGRGSRPSSRRCSDAPRDPRLLLRRRRERLPDPLRLSRRRGPRALPRRGADAAAGRGARRTRCWCCAP
ncbi:MAG: AsnC family transcriptional regulator [Comamonadaceae bacterium]|nr:AsnC family transcriptional regulator [Comamonadaceae bacterium]